MSPIQLPLTTPVQLPDDLTLRWATPEDADQLAEFNLATHSDDPDNPELFLRHWTHDLMRGIHPTTSADDFTVVVTPDGRIVSTLVLISQTWTYSGIPVAVGRPELVATLPEYRRRGLVRLQMDAVHAKSAARGEMMQIITGIPWYYRQFGYEMTVDLGGSRQLFWARPGNDTTVDEEPYTIRPATLADIDLLDALYAQQTAHSLLARPRSAADWQYELVDAHEKSVGRLPAEIIATAAGPVAYAAIEQWGTSFSITEFGVAAGHSWRAAALFLTRELQRRADEANPQRDKPITNVNFILGGVHPVYQALGNQLERQTRPYAYYIRVPDIPAFLQRITPVLEARLAGSVLAGHTGSLKMNLFRQRIELVWQDGRLDAITTFEVKRLEEGDVKFPNLTFLQLLFGYRSFEELFHAYADCYAVNVEAQVLTDILFPKQPSTVRAQD
jgi:hypothetical protein